MELDWTAYRIASEADCASPDSLDSPGARFLVSIRDNMTEAWENRDETTEPSDEAHALADAAVPVYTHELWETFVDLAAYNEDPSEYGCTAEDMTKAAQVSLYMVAERAATAVWEALDEAHEDQDEDEDEDR